MVDIVKLLFMIVGITCYAIDEATSRYFDWSCYRNRTNYEGSTDTNTLGQDVVSVNIKEPPASQLLLVGFETRVFVEDKCSLAVYAHSDWTLYSIFISQHAADVVCQTYRPIPMSVTLIRVGDVADRTVVNPDDLDHPIPRQWLKKGLVIKLQFPSFSYLGKLLIFCTPEYFGALYSHADFEIVIDMPGCPPDKYGNECSRNCHCLNDALCHDFNGACYCQKGWTGENCDVVNPILETSQSPETVLYTGNVALTCITYGMITSTMGWSKNGRIVKEMERYSLRRDSNVLTLEISHVHNYDDGMYICSAETLDSLTLSSTINLTSSDQQSFVEEPADITVIAGSDATFRCAVANRMGELRWYADTDTLVAIADDIIAEWGQARFSVDSDYEKGIYNLNITRVNTGDDREYHCEVGPGFNQAAITSNFAQLTVLEKAEKPFIEEAYDFPSLTFLLNTPETITCRANNGKPPANIYWYINDEMVSENITTRLEVGTRNRMNTVSVLTIVLSHEYVNGIITCEARSDVVRYQETTAVTLEDVKYKPRVYVTYEPLSPNEGDDVVFNCNVDANPDNVTYHWEVDGIPATQEHGAKLTRRKVKARDSDLTVTCIATNDIGDGHDTAAVSVGTGLNKKWILAIVLCGSFGLLLVLIAPALTYRYRYRIQRWLLWHFGGYEENDDKTYDAFVSYCSGQGEDDSADEDFVRKVLIPELEKDDQYIICEHHRNFIPGTDIMTNIINAVVASRRTILVLSPSFVESEWCRFEFLKAQEEMMKKKTKLIPIMFKDISRVEDMDANLKSLLSEISYIAWPREDENKDKFWDNMKYAMPRKRPRKPNEARKARKPVMLVDMNRDNGNDETQI
ncbi:uncharacterized protein [Ptychodera flava]|uniref:uncharacterized protein n=1 Tax=Ptychodera flava TaxID=63121 RepID=UPI00396A48E1